MSCKCFRESGCSVEIGDPIRSMAALVSKIRHLVPDIRRRHLLFFSSSLNNSNPLMPKLRSV